MSFSWTILIPNITIIDNDHLDELRLNLDSLEPDFTNRCVGNYASVNSSDHNLYWAGENISVNNTNCAQYYSSVYRNYGTCSSEGYEVCPPYTGTG